MRKLGLIFLFFTFALCTYAQIKTVAPTFWKLSSYSGEAYLKGTYWDQKIHRQDFYERFENSFITGGLFLNTRSYFWHPNFLELDLDLGYSPETGQRLALITPDRNEVNILKKINAKISLFQYNALNFKFFVNYNENYNNRENLTNIRSFYKDWGSILTYSNKILPFTVSYKEGRGEQMELLTQRRYTTLHNSFESKANKSFSIFDSHQLMLSHNEYVYDDRFFSVDINQQKFVVKNTINSFNLQSRFYFNTKKDYLLNSRIINDDQKGNFNYNRLQIHENVLFKLPYRFTVKANYTLYDTKGDFQDSKQNNFGGSISHLLYQSLRTYVYYNYSDVVNKPQYSETRQRSGLDVRYTKKIPLNGLLSLNYSLRSDKLDRKSEARLLLVQNEEYTLLDGEIILLKNQNVDISTVIVRDKTGSRVYQLNIDYLLIERNEFLEIRRIPGGQIPNNSNVILNYTAIQPRSFEYNGINTLYGVSISILKNGLEFYYNKTNQDYVTPVTIEYLTLNYLDRKVYGGRFRYNSFSGGVEYDNYQSTIVPYRLMKYYLLLQGNIKQKFSFSLNADLRDYLMIVEEGAKQKFYTVSGSMSYSILPRTKLKLEGAYRKQEGVGLDLDLITARCELLTRYRELFFTIGIDFYKNKLFDEKIDFRKVTVKISRKF